MDFFIVQPITVIDSSIPDNTDELGNSYPTWSNVSTYSVGAIVARSGKLYRAERNIYPLATYSWNDVSNTSTPIVVKLSDKTMITPTTVPCIKDTTVVYVEDSWKTGSETVIGKFFLFTGTTGNVDFTTIDPSSPANFTPILNYRSSDLDPIENPLSWYLVGSTNRNRCVDKSYTSQSIVTGTSVYWAFDIKNINKVTLFNVDSPLCKIELFALDDLVTPFYTETLESVLDVTGVYNWRTYSQYEPIYTSSTTFSLPDFVLPFYINYVRCKITLLSDTSTTFKLGEIAIGNSQNLALTMDGVPIQVKTSAKITELDNGDVILEDEGDLTKVFLIYNFTLKFNSDELDIIVDKCSTIINRRVVVTAESTSVTKRALVIYGFIREASPSYKSHSSKSDITLQIQRFK